MRVPENYNANATRKMSPIEAAVNSNFMPSGGAGTAENAARDARGEARTGGKLPGNERASPARHDAHDGSQIPNAGAGTARRREVKEKFLVSMSKGERAVFKAFCAMQNVSMNHFVMCAMDYFKEDMESGKVSISAHSYKRRES